MLCSTRAFKWNTQAATCWLPLHPFTTRQGMGALLHQGPRTGGYFLTRASHQQGWSRKANSAFGKPELKRAEVPSHVMLRTTPDHLRQCWCPHTERHVHNKSKGSKMLCLGETDGSRLGPAALWHLPTPRLGLSCLRRPNGNLHVISWSEDRKGTGNWRREGEGKEENEADSRNLREDSPQQRFQLLLSTCCVQFTCLGMTFFENSTLNP